MVVVHLLVFIVLVLFWHCINDDCIDDSLHKVCVFVNNNFGSLLLCIDSHFCVILCVYLLELVLVFDEGSLGFFENALLITSNSGFLFAVCLANSRLLLSNLQLATLLTPALPLLRLELIHTFMASLATYNQKGGSFNFGDPHSSFVAFCLPTNRVHNLDTIVAQVVGCVRKLAEVDQTALARALVSYHNLLLLLLLMVLHINIVWWGRR